MNAEATENPAPRIVLYTGKGGVGKSTIAAASAARAASLGVRTLILSIDSAHNLGDIFGRKIGPEPEPIAEHLDALEVDINQEIAANWSAVIDFFRNLTISSTLANQVVAEECAILPGMEEVFGLTRLLRVAKCGQYDLIVVDSPPTGDMMKILRMPDVLDWFMRRYYPIEKKIAQNIWPMVHRMSGVPVPSSEYFENVEQTYEHVKEVSHLLMEHSRCTLRLVMTPDSISFQETKRAYAMVSLFGFNVDAVMINKLLPQEADSSFFAAWLQTQQQVLEEAETAFAEVPRLRAPLEQSEPIGLERLAQFGRALFGERDPTGVYVKQPFWYVHQEGTQVEIRLRIPFLEKDHFDLWVKDNTLLINLHNTRKQIPLPRALHEKQMQGAAYQAGELRVRFQ